HNYGRTGSGTGQADDVGQLRMIEPGVEGQAQRGEPCEPGAEICALVAMWAHIRAAVADRIAGVPACRVAHAAKPPAAGLDMRLEHRLDAITQGQIGMADDARSDAGRPISATRAHRRDAV